MTTKKSINEEFYKKFQKYIIQESNGEDVSPFIKSFYDTQISKLLSEILPEEIQTINNNRIILCDNESCTAINAFNKAIAEIKERRKEAGY